MEGSYVDPVLRPQLARAAEILVRDYLAVTAGETVLITMDDAGDRTAVDAIVNSAKNIGETWNLHHTATPVSGCVGRSLYQRIPSCGG